MRSPKCVSRFLKDNEMRWVDLIVVSLWALGGKASLHDLYREVSKRRLASLPDSYDSAVRATLQAHSSDSRCYLRANPDLFYPVAIGVWKLREAGVERAIVLTEPGIVEEAISSISAAEIKSVAGDRLKLNALIDREVHRVVKQRRASLV